VPRASTETKTKITAGPEGFGDKTWRAALLLAKNP
jgi:hypothetical protein